jgi:molecular chaperone DnaK (HSP70)
MPRRVNAPLRAPEPNLRRNENVVRRPTVAIDVGTSGSSAVLVTNERGILVEDPHAGGSVWPTSVAFDGVAPRVGAAADGFGRVHPDKYQGRLKQILGEPGRLTLGDASFSPAELMGWLLAEMREQAQRVGGIDATRAVITVPASYRVGDPRRDALLEAAARAGFTAVELLYEPLATVEAPLIGGPFDPGDVGMIIDFGAGSTTAGLVTVHKNGAVELLGHDERPECSGLEIDRLIMTELLSRVGRTWSDYTRPHDDPSHRLRMARSRRSLEERARAMKHQLSVHPSAMELIGPEETPVELTAIELTALIGPVVLTSVESFRTLLGTSGVRHGDLSAVIVSGGGSRLPIVEEIVTDTFQRPVRRTVDQQRAAAEGAARFARSIERRHVRARVATDKETPLRWDIPGGHATDLEWQVEPGVRFGASDPLAVVRLDDGSLWELRPGRTGTLVRTHAMDGAQIRSGDWLVTVELDIRPFR